MARYEADVLVSMSVEVEAGGEKAARGLISDYFLNFREGERSGVGRYFVKGFSSEVKSLRRREYWETGKAAVPR